MKHNPRVTSRPATIEDIKSFYNIETLPYSIKALVFFLDGELSGIGGVRFQHGHYVVFSDILENVKVPRATILRCAHMIMDMAKQTHKELYAVKHESLVSAKRLLQSLGFNYLKPSEDGDVYLWHR